MQKSIKRSRTEDRSPPIELGVLGMLLVSVDGMIANKIQEINAKGDCVLFQKQLANFHRAKEHLFEKRDNLRLIELKKRGRLDK
jgi:hypothetical protein